MKAYDFFQRWDELEATNTTGKKLTPNDVRRIITTNYPVVVWTIEDIKYSEKILAYLGRFRLTAGDRTVTLRLTSDVARFLLEHIHKSINIIGFKMLGEEATDCVLVYQ